MVTTSSNINLPSSEEIATTPSNINLPSSQEMATTPTNLESVFLNKGYYEIQESIMGNLDRVDFKNLQLAGVKMVSLGPELQRKHLTPIGCDEEIFTLDGTRAQCLNMTNTIDTIGRCTGTYILRDPLAISGPFLRKVGCAHHICMPCRDGIEAQCSDFERGRLFTYCMPLCSEYSHYYPRQQVPPTECLCRTFLSAQWQCSPCCQDSLNALTKLAGILEGKSLLKIPWAPGNVILGLKCPIKNCKKECSTLYCDRAN